MIVIIDNGHGVDTKGKCSPVWGDGSKLWEYEFNRDIAARVAYKCKCADIPFKMLVTEMHDVSLAERVRRANAIYESDKDAFLVSVHANAGGGTGWEVWTSVGYTKSDVYATIFFEEAMTPGKLLPIQWADLDPDRAPADVKGTDADWTAKVWAAYLAVALPDEEITNREEVDKNQDKIDVDRDDLGNQGQNKLGEWTYFQGEDGNYYRYKTEGGDKDSAVKVDKAEYDLYMEALAAAAAAEDEGLGIWLWVIIGAAVLVVLGAGAVVLIIVLKKKNKNVATDDVAGFVEIIDEEATAPAEEAAAPEAKTEE
jgi:N-acetylmuramoyl-L-alanine amidase